MTSRTATGCNKETMVSKRSLIPYSDRHFFKFNIRLFVNNIFSVQTENINIFFLTDGKQNS